MTWRWSEGSASPGAWVLICLNRLTATGNLCFMYGAAFGAERYTQTRFAEQRAVRVIHRARQGIIYRNQDGNVNEWIAEAVALGIVPADWQTWGSLEQPS